MHEVMKKQRTNQEKQTDTMQNKQIWKKETQAHEGEESQTRKTLLRLVRPWPDAEENQGWFDSFFESLSCQKNNVLLLDKLTKMSESELI